MTDPYDSAMRRIQARHVRDEPFARLGASQLSEIERRLGHPLPEEYREFVSRYGFATGGGSTKFSNMDGPSEIESSVNVFYGLRPGDSYDLLNVKEGFGDLLPSHILPIASSPGGQFCLSLAGDDRGMVYWWPPHGASPDPLDDMELVARSFGSFVNSLVLVDPVDGSSYWVQPGQCSLYKGGKGPSHPNVP